MARIDTDGPITPEAAWRRYTHASAWPRWAPQVRGSSGLGDPIRAGERGWVHGPFPLRVPVRILSVDAAGRRWSWRVGVGPAAVTMEHGVDETDERSRVWLDIRLPSALALPYVPFARAALRRLAAGEP